MKRTRSRYHDRYVKKEVKKEVKNIKADLKDIEPFDLTDFLKEFSNHTFTLKTNWTTDIF